MYVFLNIKYLVSILHNSKYTRNTGLTQPFQIEKYIVLADNGSSDTIPTYKYAMFDKHCKSESRFLIDVKKVNLSFVLLLRVALLQYGSTCNIITAKCGLMTTYQAHVSTCPSTVPASRSIWCEKPTYQARVSTCPSTVPASRSIWCKSGELCILDDFNLLGRTSLVDTNISSRLRPHGFCYD